MKNTIGTVHTSHSVHAVAALPTSTDDVTLNDIEELKQAVIVLDEKYELLKAMIDNLAKKK